MDYLCELGSLALASRMKRLVGILNSGVKEIYRQERLDFEPLLMPITRLLKSKGPMSVNCMAEALGISQPAVTQLCHRLTKHDMIDVRHSPQDQRKRIVCLTNRGKARVEKLEPVWLALEKAVRQMMQSSDHHLLTALADFEGQVARESIQQRVRLLMQQQRDLSIEIVAYNPAYQGDFKRLNYEWIKKDFTVEFSDRRVLSNPQKTIIDRGGFIYFAQLRQKIVGTYALIRINDSEYELAKMAVTAEHQQKGIGTRLLDHALDQARQCKIRRLVVYSHTLLVPAVNLYFKKGFRVIPKEDHHNNRANIKMERKL